MQLSLDYLAKGGWTCHIVEKRLPIPGKHVTQDCFGFGDILAYRWAVDIGVPLNHAGEREVHGDIALIQTTSWGNFTARRHKIIANPHHKPWLKAGGRIFLHGWGDKGLREEEL